MYIYLYICVRFELKFSTGQVTPGPNRTVRFKTGHLATLSELSPITHFHSSVTKHDRLITLKINEQQSKHRSSYPRSLQHGVVMSYASISHYRRFCDAYLGLLLSNIGT